MKILAWVIGFPLGVLIAYLLIGTDPAWAQEPTEKGYGGVPEQANPDSPRSLPFTGFDLLLLIGAGVLLLAAGLTLRRVGRTRRG